MIVKEPAAAEGLLDDLFLLPVGVDAELVRILHFLYLLFFLGIGPAVAGVFNFFRAASMAAGLLPPGLFSVLQVNRFLPFLLDFPVNIVYI